MDMESVLMVARWEEVGGKGEKGKGIKNYTEYLWEYKVQSYKI